MHILSEQQPPGLKNAKNCSSSRGCQFNSGPHSNAQLYSRKEHVYSLLQKEKVLVSISVYFPVRDNCSGMDLYLTHSFKVN